MTPMIMQHLIQIRSMRLKFWKKHNIEGLFLQNVMLFYLQLESKYLIPSTIQHIIEQCHDIHRLGQTVIFQKIF